MPEVWRFRHGVTGTEIERDVSLVGGLHAFLEANPSYGPLGRVGGGTAPNQPPPASPTPPPATPFTGAADAGFGPQGPGLFFNPPSGPDTSADDAVSGGGGVFAVDPNTGLPFGEPLPPGPFIRPDGSYVVVIPDQPPAGQPPAGTPPGQPPAGTPSTPAALPISGGAGGFEAQYNQLLNFYQSLPPDDLGSRQAVATSLGQLVLQSVLGQQSLAETNVASNPFGLNAQQFIDLQSNVARGGLSRSDVVGQAELNRQAQGGIARTQAGAQTEAARLGARGQVQAAEAGAAGQVQAASLAASATVDAARQQRFAAQDAAAAQMFGAGKQVEIANIEASSSQTIAGLTNTTAETIAGIQRDAAESVAAANADAMTAAAITNKEAQIAVASAAYNGQVDAARAAGVSDETVARIQAQMNQAVAAATGLTAENVAAINQVAQVQAAREAAQAQVQAASITANPFGLSQEQFLAAQGEQARGGLSVEERLAEISAANAPERIAALLAALGNPQLQGAFAGYGQAAPPQVPTISGLARAPQERAQYLEGLFGSFGISPSQLAQLIQSVSPGGGNPFGSSLAA